MIGALVDNDVIIKVAAYGLEEQFVQLTTVLGTAPSILGVGRFVIRDRLTQKRRLNDSARAIAHFEILMRSLALLEPTDAELEQAAAFEAAAVRANLEFDTGESQLLAMLLARRAKLLVTGDKRAIVAVTEVCGDAADGRIACFEQVVTTTIKAVGVAPVRGAVCGEPRADQATTNCCACSSSNDPSMEDVIAGLKSYINDLRTKAGGVLYVEDDLLALAAQKDSVGID